MINKFTQRTTILLLISIALCYTVFGQYKDDNILEQKLAFDLSEATFLEVCTKLAVDYKIPIGLERSSDYYEKIYKEMYYEDGSLKPSAGKISIRRGTLREVLNSLVSQDPTYTWEINDNVVNIFPVESRDEFIKSVLETKISKLGPVKNLEVFQIRNTIYNLPEIKQLLETNNIRTITGNYSRGRKFYLEDEINISDSDIRIKKLLNEIIQASTYKFWLIERSGNKKEYLEIFF